MSSKAAQDSYISDDLLARLRSSLPARSYKKIAKRSGLSYSLVAKVMGGQIRNWQVVRTAMEVLSEQSADSQGLILTITKLYPNQ